MDFKQYLFPCNEVWSIVGKKRGSSLTSAQTVKALNALSRDNLLTLTKTDIEIILAALQSYSETSADSLSTTGIPYLMDVYLNATLKINRLPVYSEVSPRQFQMNGYKNEKVALQILSEMDNFEYVKNRKTFDNGYFCGIPDVLPGHSVFEIKTRHLYCDFLAEATGKATRSDFYQLQCEMDITGMDEGELIYVATGINKEDRDKYLQHCRKSMEKNGMNDEKIEKKLILIERSCNIDWLPPNKRVKRIPVKRNPEFIRFAKRKVTAARNYLARLHDKFEKM